MKVTVAATQLKRSWDIEKNIKDCDKMIEKLASEGANIILLQELFKTPYFCQTEDYEHFKLAECVNDSHLIKHYQEIAKKYHVVLPISFFEKENNNYYNSIVVCDSDGSVSDVYRKSHIPTGQCYEEKFYFTPGDTGFKVFDTHFGRIGVGICWDQWFPEAARIMTLLGAQLLFYPTAIGSEPVLNKDSASHWQNVMKGHAAANVIPVVASNRVGEEKQDDSSMVFFGHSFICDQHGDILKEIPDGQQGYILYTFDLDEIDEERVSWGVFRDRRIDLYKPILTHNGVFKKK